MLSSLKTVLLLSVLCAPRPSHQTSSLCLWLSSSYPDDLYQAAGARELLCGSRIYRAGAVQRSGGGGGGDYDDWDTAQSAAAYGSSSAEFLSSATAAESSDSRERERRTSSSSFVPLPNHPPNIRFLSQTKLRSKLLQQQNSVRGGGGVGAADRRSKFTLSLDVPTNIMNVLFDIAKAKSLRAKAADNARLLAQIGRRK